jgi:Bacterial PH domain
VALIEPTGGPPPPGEQYLLPGEVAVIIVPRHWIMVAGPFLWGLGALLAAGILTAMVEAEQPITTYIWLLTLAVLAWTTYRFLSWYVERFMVTDRRLVLVTGLINRKVAVIPLRKVTDMTYQRTVPGRLFGYGEFVIESAAQDQALREVDFLPNPDALYQRVSQLLFSRPEADPTSVITQVRRNRLPRAQGRSAYAPPPPRNGGEGPARGGDPSTQPIPIVRPVEPHGARPVRDPRARRPRR